MSAVPRLSLVEGCAHKKLMGSQTLTATQYPSCEAHVGTLALRLVLIKEIVVLCFLLPCCIVGARFHMPSDLDSEA